MGIGPVAARRLIGVAEGVAEVQQAARAGIPLVGSHQRCLYPQAPGDNIRPFRRVGLQQFQQRGVADEAVFDDLRHTAAQLAFRQRGKAVRVYDHQRRLVKGSQLVLPLRKVHRRLAAHGAVHLRQQGGGNLHQRHAPLIAGGGKARQIAGNTAAQRQHAVGAGKAPLCQLVAKTEPRLRRLVLLPRREGQQLSGKARVTQAVQHSAAVQRRHRIIRHHRPAAAGQRRQQRPGLPQQAGLDMNTVAARRQRHGHGHGAPPKFTFLPFYRTFPPL